MKMIFGGIYRKIHGCFYESGNDQHYGFYIPVIYKDKDGHLNYRMVDTYMVHNPCWGDKSMAKRIWYLEQANQGETSWMIYTGCSGFYYKNVVNLSSDELSEDVWELIADLHDYVIVGDDDSYDYAPEDVLRYLPLWNEDSFRWDTGFCGRMYLKKNAKKDGSHVYAHAKSDCSFGFVPYSAMRFINTCKDVLENMTVPRGMKKDIKLHIKEARKYLKLEREFNKFRKELYGK